MRPSAIARRAVQPGAGHDPSVESLEAVFRALADPTRLQVLQLLGKADFCVCELQALLEDVSQPLLSHHLGLLKRVGLVRTRREARMTIYALDRGGIRQAGLASLRIFRNAGELSDEEIDRISRVGRKGDVASGARRIRRS